jgi:hypothetical protein
MAAAPDGAGGRVLSFDELTAEQVEEFLYYVA